MQDLRGSRVWHPRLEVAFQVEVPGYAVEVQPFFLAEAVPRQDVVKQPMTTDPAAHLGRVHPRQPGTSHQLVDLHGASQRVLEEARSEVRRIERGFLGE